MGAAKLVTVVRSGIAGEMKYLRLQRNLTLEVICDQLHWQQSKLSRMENGEQCISHADLAALLVIYGVHGKERQRLLHMANRQDDPGYWENLPIAEESKTLMRLEPDATSIVSAEPMRVPGLVQTADYACAMMKAHLLPSDQAEQKVEARRSRQSVYTKDNPAKVDLIVDETALRRVVGNHKSMARQLRAMLEAAERPNVRLWVVPFELGGNAGFDSHFFKMNFPRNQSVVFLEQKTLSIFVEDATTIDYFARYAAKLAKVALDPAKSIDRVAAVAKEHERA